MLPIQKPFVGVITPFITIVAGPLRWKTLNIIIFRAVFAAVLADPASSSLRRRLPSRTEIKVPSRTVCRILFVFEVIELEMMFFARH